MALIPTLPTPPSGKLAKLSTQPTKINVKTGTGVPGGFFSGNYKKVSQGGGSLKSKLASALGTVPKLPTLPTV
jgi:hypothetical protein